MVHARQGSVPGKQGVDQAENGSESCPDELRRCDEAKRDRGIAGVLEQGKWVDRNDQKEAN